jgi:hypothetical protein
MIARVSAIFFISSFLNVPDFISAETAAADMQTDNTKKT